MNKKLYFQCLKLCSGHYLSQNINNDWNDLTEEEQEEFLRQNAWEPLQEENTSLIWKTIESAAQVTHNFIQNLNEEI